MLKRIVVLSGNVCSGKTTLADSLCSKFGLASLKTKKILKDTAIAHLGQEIEAERGAMQRFGERLDRKTNGRWVLDGVMEFSQGLPGESIVIVDAVRIPEQIERLRDAFGSIVFHIHLEAPREELKKRYARRRDKEFREFSTYEQVELNPTERKVKRLRNTADVVIDTKRSVRPDVVIRAASHLGLFCKENSRLVDVLVGGEYGSEGKGHVASYLAPEYQLLVRVGGPNAGHTVYRNPPFKHYQLPSGTWFCEADLVIGPGAVLNVEKLLKEIADCGVSAARLSVDPMAMIISASDIKREGGLVRDIGSTGQGVGFATARRITDRGKTSVKLARDIRDLKPYVHDTQEIFERAYREGKKILLEGTQGSGLSLFHGSYPHVTSRDTTVAGCLSEAGISPSRVRKIVMTARSYPIRVQDPSKSTSGPMSQEISWKEISTRSGIPQTELVANERTTTTNRKRRVGEFDWVLLRRAVSLNGPTDIALTFADYFSIDNRSARRFEQLTRETVRFVEEIEKVASVPVSLITTRFHTRSIIDRRSW